MILSLETRVEMGTVAGSLSLTLTALLNTYMYHRIPLTTRSILQSSSILPRYQPYHSVYILMIFVNALKMYDENCNDPKTLDAGVYVNCCNFGHVPLMFGNLKVSDEYSFRRYLLFSLHPFFWPKKISLLCLHTCFSESLRCV